MKDVEFMTAKEKELVLKQWKKFVAKIEEVWSKEQIVQTDLEGLYNTFTKRIYDQLHLHCSFIAHFSRDGFFSTYFVDPEDLINFLHQFDEDCDYTSIEYGMEWISGDYADLNIEMCKVVGEHKEKLYDVLSRHAKNDDIEEAKKLLSKHGIAVEVG